MTVQEAIEKLKYIKYIGNGEQEYKKCSESIAIDMAIEALEKQIPKNWIEEDIGDCEYAWKCPSCNSVFVLMDGTPQDNEYNYCPNCGQSMAERKGDVV